MNIDHQQEEEQTNTIMHSIIHQHSSAALLSSPCCVATKSTATRTCSSSSCSSRIRTRRRRVHFGTVEFKALSSIITPNEDVDELSWESDSSSGSISSTTVFDLKTYELVRPRRRRRHQLIKSTMMRCNKPQREREACEERLQDIQERLEQLESRMNRLVVNNDKNAAQQQETEFGVVVHRSATMPGVEHLPTGTTAKCA